MKFLTILLVLLTSFIFAQQGTSTPFKDTNTRLVNIKTERTSTRIIHTVTATQAGNGATIISNNFAPETGNKKFGGFLGVTVTVDSIDGVWPSGSEPDTLAFSLETLSDAGVVVLEDSILFRQVTATGTTKNEIILPADDGKMWFWQNTPSDTAATNLYNFPWKTFRLKILTGAGDDSLHFKFSTQVFYH